MADKSENPQDNAELRRLKQDLGGIKDDLSAELRRAQDLTASAETDRQRAQADRTAARQEAAARGVRSPKPIGAAAQGNPVDQIKAQSAALDAQVTAEERLARATERRAQSVTNAAEAVRRARANEYLGNVPPVAGRPGRAGYGGPAPVGAPAGATPSGVAAGQVQAAVEASRLAAEAAARYAQLHQYPEPIGPQLRGQANQFPTPIGPQPRGQVNQFPKPIGPLSPKGVQEAGLAAARLAENEDKALQDALRLTPAVRTLNGALGEQAQVIGLGSDAYTRHGYLTSEFITAAGRGEVSMRQLGEQVGGTIAKFAGWTAAAGSVYGVVAALGALYRGAMQSASGVGLVNRVATTQLPGGSDALQQQFRDMGRKFNLPMEDIVQATYGAAKATGGDLPQALQAAQSALFGVKVGELSAADSTRYLQSIMRGFGATAGELPDIFDAINQAQNRFGGSTGDMIAGVAKAAGSFRLAGGNYRQLISLITTGTRVTGASGLEVSTAISRSASRVLTPQGADALRVAGLDPTQNYPQLIAEAMGKARKANYDPRIVNQLSRALVPQGGQYARIFNPLLSNQQLYKDVYEQLDPNKASGSASKELAKALAQPDEQIKRLVIDLERLGATMAQAGGLNLLVGLVKLLDESLNAAVKLVDVFNAFTPGPLRQILAPLLELSLIMKGLRRFDAGSSLPRGAAGGAYERFRSGLERDPDALNAAQIRRGVRDHETVLQDKRRTVGLSTADAVYAADRAEERAINARKTYQALPLGSAARDVAREDFQKLSVVHGSKQETMKRLLEDQDDVIGRQVELQKQIATYDKLRAEKMSAEVAAQKAGFLYTPGTLERPVAQVPQRIGGGGEPIMVPGVPGARIPHTADEIAKAERIAAEVAQAEAAAMQRRMHTMGGRDELAGVETAAEAEARRRAASVPGRAGRALAPAFSRASELAADAAALASESRAAGVAGAVGKTSAGAIRSAGTGIKAGLQGMSAMGAATIAGLDGALIAIPAAIVIWGKIHEAQRASEEQVARLQSMAGGVEGIRSAASSYKESNDRSLGATLSHPIHAFGLGIKGLSSDLAGAANWLIPFGDPANNQRKNEERALAQNKAEADALEKAQKKNALLFIPQIQANFKRGLANAQTPQEIEAALEAGLKQIDSGYAKTFGDQNAREVANRVRASFIEQTTALAAARGSLNAAQKHVTDLAGLKGFATGVTTSIGLSGANDSNLKGAAFGIRYAREQIGRDPTQAAAALTQINALETAVQQEVSSTLSTLLPLAKSPAQAAQYRAQAVDQLRTGLTSDLQSRASNLSGAITATQNAITQTQGEIASGQGGAGAKERLKGLQSRLAGRKNRLTQIQEGLKQENETVQQFEAEQARAQFQLESSVFDATTTRRAGAIHNPVQALRFQLARARSRLPAILEQYGSQSVEYQNALTQEQQLQEQLVQAEIQRIQTSSSLRAARTTNPVIQARITLDGTNRALADLARRGRQQTEQYQQLLIQKAQQQQQLVQAQIQSFQSVQQLNRARSNIGASPGAQLQGALSDAQGFATYIQGLGADATPDQIRQALTAVAQAQGALADYARQQAQAMVQAQGDLAKSRTTDPVKQATIDLRTAQQNVKFAQSPAERVSALAAVGNAKRNVHDVKLQNAESDIDFEREMNYISVSTAIARYRALLKDKTNSKAQRQDILRKIKGLQNDKSGDNSFNLDAASIRLPTPYEVFRAIKEGSNATQRANLRGAVQNTNHIVITVADQTDVQKVADVFDQYLDTSAASSLRAMGVA